MTHSTTYLAPAKINLFLHIIGKLPNGYHALESLFVFANQGDRLQFQPASHLTLEVTGPFHDALTDAAPEHNLVYKAALALQKISGTTKGAKITLEKNIPIAAGLGGGSSDAATTIRSLMALWELDIPEPELYALATSLGADIPSCLYGKACYVEGLGEKLTPITFPKVPLVLVTPPCAISTIWSYQQIRPPYTASLEHFPTAFEDMDGLVQLLSSTQNDMAAAAHSKEPMIHEVLDALATSEGCLLSRLSGSGPTCYGLFENIEAADHAATQLQQEHPDWWSCAVVVG